MRKRVSFLPHTSFKFLLLLLFLCSSFNTKSIEPDASCLEPTAACPEPGMYELCTHQADTKRHLPLTRPGERVLYCWSQLYYLLQNLMHFYKVLLLDFDETFVEGQPDDSFKLSQPGLDVFLTYIAEDFKGHPESGELHIVTSRTPNDLAIMLKVFADFGVPITQNQIHFASSEDHRTKRKSGVINAEIMPDILEKRDPKQCALILVDNEKRTIDDAKGNAAKAIPPGNKFFLRYSVDKERGRCLESRCVGALMERTIIDADELEI